MIITDEMRKEWREEFFNIINSPDTRERSIEMYKCLSYMSVEDWFKKITI